MALPTSDGQTIHSVPSSNRTAVTSSIFGTRRDQETAGIYLSSLDAKPDEPMKRVATTGWEAQYVPTADPHLGYLLFMQEGTVMAQPFDNRRLE